VNHPQLRAFALAALVLAAACDDMGSGPSDAQPPVIGAAKHHKLLGSVTCRVDVATQATKCAPAAAAGGANETRILLNSWFTVQTSGSFTNNGVATFFNTIRNDLGQSIGTNNGINADTIYAFLTSIQTTGGSGTVTAANADGTFNFTAPNQPFWKWRQIVEPGDNTATSTWTFNVPSTVTSWTYTVNLSAPIAHPDGWIEISGTTLIQRGQYQLLTATVYDWTGEVDETDDNVAWTGTNVSGQIYVTPWDERTGHILGLREGTAEVTASFGLATPDTIGVEVY
jgi:hypothetical protein